MERYYSHGKLLLTGEYAVLDGALALALPTKLGQSMTVESSSKKGLSWKSYGQSGQIWYENEFTIEWHKNDYGYSGQLLFDGTDFSEEEKDITETLGRILLGASILNFKFPEQMEGVSVNSHLEFDRNWGLGSSSTLIQNVAYWAGVDAYELLQKSMGGSGYDVACAAADGPILYQLQEGQPSSLRVDFNPEFKDELCFVYLGQKQKSSEAIRHYRKLGGSKSNLIATISELTKVIHQSQDLDTFEKHLEEHEEVMSKALELPRVQSGFPDYPGVLKSLGAWGGDFILATRTEEAKDYFKKKGLTPVIPFSELIL